MNIQEFGRRLRSEGKPDQLMDLMRKLQRFEVPQMREMWDAAGEGWIVWADGRWPPPPPPTPSEPPCKA